MYYDYKARTFETARTPAALRSPRSWGERILQVKAHHPFVLQTW